MGGSLNRARVVAALLLSMLTVRMVAAQTSTSPRQVQPERPTVATHAGTVAPGYLEVEGGVERDRFSADETGLVAPFVFKFGVGDHTQLSVFAPFASSDAGSGLGDLGVGIKWRLLDDAPVLGDFAILPALKAPTGSFRRGTGTGTTDASILLISSHALGSVAMDLNVGIVARTGNRDALPRSSTVWTASFGGPFTPHVGWVAEVFGYGGTGGPAGAPGSAAVLAGPTALVAEWLALDIGVIVPLTGPQPHAFYLGGVYNVGRLR